LTSSSGGVVITFRTTVTHFERAIGETFPSIATGFGGANRAIARLLREDRGRDRRLDRWRDRRLDRGRDRRLDRWRDRRLDRGRVRRLALTSSSGGVVITLRRTICRRGSVSHFERAIGETIPIIATGFGGANRAIAKSRGGKRVARANSRGRQLVKITLVRTTFVRVCGGRGFFTDFAVRQTATGSSASSIGTCDTITAIW